MINSAFQIIYSPGSFTVSIVVLLLTVSACGGRIEPEIYYFDDGYVGDVRIVFDQADGAPERYEEGVRVYQIGRDTVHRTQFPPNYGKYTTEDKKYFYVAGNERVKELKWLSHFALFHRMYDPVQGRPKRRVDSLELVVIEGGLLTVNSNRVKPSQEVQYKVLTIDTFKNLLHLQRSPDSIYYRKFGIKKRRDTLAE